MKKTTRSRLPLAGETIRRLESLAHVRGGIGVITLLPRPSQDPCPYTDSKTCETAP